MSLGVVVKRPDDRLDFDIDFTRWLPDGDRLDSAVASVAGGSITIDGCDTSDTQVRVWLIDGAPGDSADVTVTATTAQERTKEVCFRVRVKGC